MTLSLDNSCRETRFELENLEHPTSPADREALLAGNAYNSHQYRQLVAEFPAVTIVPSACYEPVSPWVADMAAGLAIEHERLEAAEAWLDERIAHERR